MATTCYIPILGKRMRVTALDSCGNVPAAGTVDSQLVTDGFISVALTAEVEDGAEIIQKKADGSLCVNEKLSNVFKRFTVEATFCGVNPSLIAMVNNVAGVAVGEGPVTKKFALELWTGISGQACLPGAAFLGGYFLLPFVNAGIIGDITVDGENAVNFSMTGAYTRGQNAWGVGPYNVLLNGSSVASQLPLALDPYDHLLLVETSYAPPPRVWRAAPSPRSPARASRPRRRSTSAARRARRSRCCPTRRCAPRPRRRPRARTTSPWSGRAGTSPRPRRSSTPDPAGAAGPSSLSIGG
jgi:hypothetical protein